MYKSDVFSPDNHVVYLDSERNKLYVHPPPGSNGQLEYQTYILDAVPAGYKPDHLAILPLPTGNIIDVYIGCSPPPGQPILVQKWQLNLETIKGSCVATISVPQGSSPNSNQQFLYQLAFDKTGMHLMVSYTNPDYHEHRIWHVPSEPTNVGWVDDIPHVLTGSLLWLD